MKKQLLFVMDTFPLGGISKSLLSLLAQIDFTKYDVDLLLMKKEGLFIESIPKEVNVISDVICNELREPSPKYFFKVLKKRSFVLLLKWLDLFFSCAWGRMTGGLSEQIVQLDKKIAKYAKKLDKHYDAAIAYQGGRCIYYILDKINAEVKIGYVHNDYKKYDILLLKSDKKYYPKLNYIVTVSEQCKNVLDEVFPECKSKTRVIYNICSPKIIKEMANNEKGFLDNYQGLRILSMCRIDINQKGLDIAVEACANLINDGYNIRWYILGDGDEKQSLEKIIDQYKIKDNFILLGSKLNPYPFLLETDIYAQTSRFEGKSVATDEAKALCKPIIVTNFSTVNDQIVDGVNGVIVDISAKEIHRGLKKFIDDNELRKQLTLNLFKEHVGNEDEVYKFYGLL